MITRSKIERGLGIKDPKILSICPIIMGTKDEVVWSKERNGNYTVRSGYEYRKESKNGLSHMSMHSSWKRLWKEKINNKWKIFLWKILNKSLPKEFIRRRIIIDSVCKFCKVEVESLEHLFRDCNISRHIWAAGRLGLRTENQANIPIADWIWNGSVCLGNK